MATLLGGAAGHLLDGIVGGDEAGDVVVFLLVDDDETEDKLEP